MMQQDKSQLKIGIILNYINIGLGNLIPIFYTPIMLALLGQSEYGLYKLSSSVTSYLSLISLGIGSAVTRYLIKYRAEGDKDAEEKILGLFMIIFQIIAVATFVIGVILTFNLDIWYGNSLTDTQLTRMRILVFVMVCNMAISFSVSPYISVVNAHEKFIFLQCMNILSTCIAPLLNLVVLWLGYASIGMAVSSLAMNVVVRFCYLVYIRKTLKIRAQYKDMPTHLLREILTFSFWVFVGNIVGQLYNATDTVMIGTVPELSTKGIAVYSIGATLSYLVGSVATGISNLLAPKTNHMVFSGAKTSELLEFAIRMGRIQGYIIFLVVTGFVSFGQPFIQLYAGNGYEDAYWIAVIMMIPEMIPILQSVFLNIVVAENRHRFRAMMYLAIAILNVIGTWIFMKFIGIIGAALMTGIASLIGPGIIMNWYYWKRMKFSMPKFWREVGCIAIIPLCMSIIVLWISQYIDFYNIINMLAGIIIYTIIYIILNWYFVMNDYEKNIIVVPLHKLMEE